MCELSNPRGEGGGDGMASLVSSRGHPSPSLRCAAFPSPAVHSRAGRVPLRAFPAAAARGPGASGGGGLAGHRVFAGFFPGGPGGATAFGFDAGSVVSRGVQPSAVSTPAWRRPLWQGGEHCPPFGLVG